MGYERLAGLEAAYFAARDTRDRLDVARARGEPGDTRLLEADAARTERAVRLVLERFDMEADARDSGVEAGTLDGEDERALAAIRAGVAAALGDEGGLPVTPTATLAECDDPRTWSAALATGGSTLRQHAEACYGAVAQSLDAGGERLNRLQVLARLATTASGERRRELFLALRPLWCTVDGERSAGGRHGSPYAALIQESALAWRAGHSPIAANAAALGISEPEIEAWVMAILDVWRVAIVEPDRAGGQPPMEPWDWWWRAASAGQARTDVLPRDGILVINDRVYASLGANLDALGVVLDVTPRPSRPAVPVAFTTFGGRPHEGPDGAWWRGRPTVLATYVEGGVDELAELIHETGHAIHLAAIHTRPAFTDWPASDALTEALADLVAHDVPDEAWQRQWLPQGSVIRETDTGGTGAGGTGADGSDADGSDADGSDADGSDGTDAGEAGAAGAGTGKADAAATDAIRRRDQARARYAPTVLDAAWTLLEIRQHADPDRPANDIWTEITSHWLGVASHPEWSWWAMRGQLIQGPGYMANYTIGAVLAADMRAAIRTARGSWIGGDPGWYAWVSERLYRFGLERSPAAVLRDLLGRSPSAEALLAEMAGAGLHA